MTDPKEDHNHDYERAANKSANATVVIAICTGVLVIATGIYTFFSAKQWCAMRQQLSQSDRHFEEGRRPWIAIDNRNDGGVELGEPIIFTPDKSYAIIRLRFTLTNVGAAPGRVMVFGGIYSRPRMDDIFREVNGICDKAKPPNGTMGEFPWVVIPNLPMTFDVLYTPIPDKVWVHGDPLEIAPKAKEIEPTVLGCILYYPPPSKERQDASPPYQTPFVAQLSAKRDGKCPPRNDDLPIPIKDSIPKDNVCVKEVLMVGEAR